MIGAQFEPLLLTELDKADEPTQKSKKLIKKKLS